MSRQLTHCLILGRIWLVEDIFLKLIFRLLLGWSLGRGIVWQFAVICLLVLLLRHCAAIAAKNCWGIFVYHLLILLCMISLISKSRFLSVYHFELRYGLLSLVDALLTEVIILLMRDSSGVDIFKIALAAQIVR